MDPRPGRGYLIRAGGKKQEKARHDWTKPSTSEFGLGPPGGKSSAFLDPACLTLHIFESLNIWDRAFVLSLLNNNLQLTPKRQDVKTMM